MNIEEALAVCMSASKDWLRRIIGSDGKTVSSTCEVNREALLEVLTYVQAKLKTEEMKKSISPLTHG